MTVPTPDLYGVGVFCTATIVAWIESAGIAREKEMYSGAG